MNKDCTIAVIKPNVIESKNIAQALNSINLAGFHIENMKYIKSAPLDFVKEFYQIHENKEFYNKLIQGMSNRPWLVLQLSNHSSKNVVKDWREWVVILRRCYSGKQSYDNGIHGSDSVESACIEYNLVFNKFRNL